MFSNGQLITPDFFLLFPGTRSTDGIAVYLSQWNPGVLGYSSSQPASYVLLSMLSIIGIPPALLEPLTLISFSFVGAVSFQRLLEPHLEQPKFALIGGILFLLSPYLFIDVFDASGSIPFDLLLPTVFLLSLRIAQGSWAKPVILLSLVLGFIFAFVPFGPVYVLPLLLLLPLSLGLTRQSLRTGLRLFGGITMAVALALLLNAPFYFGNLTYFTSGAIQPSFGVATSIVPISYGFSYPLNFFSLLGAGLSVRYAIFYPPPSEALLVGFSGFALSGLLFVRLPKYRELGHLVALLYVSCGLWIFLTAAGFTLPLYKAFGLLTIFNYPGEFYAYIVVSLTILATFTIDRIANLEQSGLSTDMISLSPGTTGTDRRTGHTHPVRLRHGINRAIHQPGTVASCALVLILLVAPAGFYLESGDFNVLEAPGTFGLPPQWGPTVPSAYPAMDSFLELHGGISDSRFLVLPFPGPGGGSEFGPFAINTFGLAEYEGATSVSNLFVGPLSSDYSTTVLNYLIQNRTDRIGVLLGQASVRYVLVDLQANFTGPPQWNEGSLIGSPTTFLDLLRAQRDLEDVFNSSLFVAFLNIDYRPFVTAAPGIAVVQAGNASVPLNQTVGSWPANLSRWSMPGPANLINGIQDTTNGYEVFGVNGSGVMNITVLSASNTITGSSTQLSNPGFYLVSNRIPVEDQMYGVRFYQNYTGPTKHLGGYVTVAGFDSVGAILWEIPSYTVGTPTQPNVSVPFSPQQLNPLTADVGITVAFPTNFGSGSLATYTVSNLSLSLDFPSVPSVLVAELPLSQLPSSSALSAYIPLPTIDFSSSIADALTTAGTPVREVCFDLCDSNASVSDQLFFAYSSLDFPGYARHIEATPTALAGEVIASNGSLNASLTVNPSPFASLALHVSGNGSVAVANGSMAIANFTVTNRYLEWLPIALQSEVRSTQLRINVRGSIELDSLLLGPFDPRSSATASTGNSTLTITSTSLTEYSGTLGNMTSIVMLSDGFSSLWSMTVDSTITSSHIVAGWEDGFVVPKAFKQNDFGYVLQFEGQSIHLILVGVQALALTILLASLLIVSVFAPPLRIGRAIRWLMQRRSGGSGKTADSNEKPPRRN